MKKAILIILLILALLAVGCTDTEEPKTNPCVLCGGPATMTVMGPDSQMESMGIPLSKCSSNASGFYSAHLCSECNDVPISNDTGWW